MTGPRWERVFSESPDFPTTYVLAVNDDWDFEVYESSEGVWRAIFTGEPTYLASAATPEDAMLMCAARAKKIAAEFMAAAKAPAEACIT